MPKYHCVATGHPETSQAACEILLAGGNAVDAALAAGFCAPVSEPMLTSLAGGGFCLVQEPQGHPVLYDFFVNFPGLDHPAPPPLKLEPLDVQFGEATQRFFIGDSSIATPGVLKGFLELHKQYGKLPLSEILNPAIQLAKKGCPLNHVQAYVIRILYPIMVQSPKGKELFEPHGKLLQEGDLFINKDYALFLEELAQNPDFDFYNNNHLTQTLLKELSPQSLLTRKDLLSFKVIKRKPLYFKYKDSHIYTNPLPSLGGSLIITMLQKAQNNLWTNFGSPQHLQELTQIMLDTEKENSSRFTKGTTHISVSDKNGMTVGLSLSNGQGCGHFIPHTGIMLNNMLGEDDLFQPQQTPLPSGTRMPSMMAPTFLHNGQKQFMLGSGGSKRIRSSLMQVISNLVDFNMSLEKAIHSPRINWDQKVLQVEKGFPSFALQTLKEKIPINEWSDLAFYFGGTHCIQVFEQAIGDRRRGGSGLTC